MREARSTLKLYKMNRYSDLIHRQFGKSIRNHMHSYMGSRISSAFTACPFCSFSVNVIAVHYSYWFPLWIPCKWLNFWCSTQIWSNWNEVWCYAIHMGKMNLCMVSQLIITIHVWCRFISLVMFLDWFFNFFSLNKITWIFLCMLLIHVII